MTRRREIRDVMTTDVVTVSPDTPLSAVAKVLAEGRIGGVPVVEAGRVVGVICRSDLRPADALTEPDPPRLRLSELQARRPGGRRQAMLRAVQAMSSPAVTIGPDQPVGVAAWLMVARMLGRLPVVEAGRLVGIVSRGDLVRAFARPDADLIALVRGDVLVKAMWLDPARFTVSAQDGVVAIRGSVGTWSMAILIEQLIACTPGVVGVQADLSWSLDDRPLPAPPTGHLALSTHG